jgi:phage shock protein PspC (stress-responsive transcriptional regulator)
VARHTINPSLVGVLPLFSVVFFILFLFLDVYLLMALFLLELPPNGALPRRPAAIHPGG